jgi:broad specificity phosphatase PhoE
MMKIIYFVRHGECQANIEQKTAGSRNDSPLTKLGLRQADETGEKLKGLQADLVVSAPLSRCTDTARRIADKIGYKGEIQLGPELTERDFGVMSGEPREIALPQVDAGTVDDLESLEDFATRMRHVLELFKTLPGERVLVVGHSGAERMMRTIYEGRPYQTWLETPDLHNGDVREYEISP